MSFCLILHWIWGMLYMMAWFNLHCFAPVKPPRLRNHPGSVRGILASLGRMRTIVSLNLEETHLFCALLAWRVATCHKCFIAVAGGARNTGTLGCSACFWMFLISFGADVFDPHHACSNGGGCRSLRLLVSIARFDARRVPSSFHRIGWRVVLHQTPQFHGYSDNFWCTMVYFLFNQANDSWATHGARSMHESNLFLYPWPKIWRLSETWWLGCLHIDYRWFLQAASHDMPCGHTQQHKPGGDLSKDRGLNLVMSFHWWTAYFGWRVQPTKSGIKLKLHK
jgi:hypothetical protein